VLQLGHIGASVGEVAHTALPRARQVAALRAELLSFRTTQYAHMLSDDETEQAGFKQRIQQIAGQVAQTRQRIEPLLSDTTQRSAYEAFARQWTQYLQGNEKVLMLTGDFGAKALGGDYGKTFEAMNASLGDILKANDVVVDEQVQATESAVVSTRTAILGTVVAALGLGTLLAWFLSRRIVASLGEASRSARAVAKGDLTARIPAEGMTRWAPCSRPWARCRPACPAWCTPCAPGSIRWPPPRPRSPPATWTCPAAPSSRPPACSAPPRPCSSWPATCTRAPMRPARPSRWPATPPRWPSAAAAWCAMW
jgi:HAMP domain-containing protein